MPWCCGWPAVSMGAALSSPQEGGVVAAVTSQPQPTMADVIRERKKKAGGAALGTLRRRLAAARADRHKTDRGCEHARYIRHMVATWRLPQVVALCGELEALHALRDLTVQAELAREPAAPLHVALHAAYTHRWWCDVQLVGAGYVISAHRAILCARCVYFRELLGRHPSNAWLVPLEGAGGALSRDEMEAAVTAVYGMWHHAADYEEGCAVEGGNSNQRGRGDTALECRCEARGAGSAALLRRLGAVLGLSARAMPRDMQYLLDSGEYADCRLVFRLEGAQFGFRTALELPCHRAVLGARSRYFRTMMSLGGVSGGTLCVDDSVLPRRLARALLHAAYTDQVDLSLISRDVSPPPSTNTSTSGHTSWSNMAAMAGKSNSATRNNNAISRLDDAFALLEVARFLEMPIVVQGCEDAIAAMLSPRTLPHILRRADHPIATPWLMRQAMRYLQDEFAACVGDAAGVELPRGAVADALASPLLQAGEGQALRALVRWAERLAANQRREPNVVWHTAHSVARKGAKRRDVTDAHVKEILSPLLPLLRLDAHAALQPDVQQLVRRGILPACSLPSTDDLSADSWLPAAAVTPRCFLPYLDELKSLLEGQTVDGAEVERIIAERYSQPIPDTLYMVAATRPAVPPVRGAACEAACVPRGVVRGLRARLRELHAHARTRPLRHHAHAARMQLALRAVREVSLPDACAELLVRDDDVTRRDSDTWDPDETEGRGQQSSAPDCCSVGGGDGGGEGSSSAGGGVWTRCGSAASVRPPSLHAAGGSNPSTLRRASPPAARPLPRLPDIALPDANAHLLTPRDYYTHTHKEYGAVLQLDLGDGATHTPRPGSRAQRAAAAERLQQRRDVIQGASSPRPRHADRAAVEMSGLRGYGMHPAGDTLPSPAAVLSPPCYRNTAQASTSNANTPRPTPRTPPTPARRPLSASPGPRGHLHRTGGTLNRSGGLLEHNGGMLNRSGGLLEQSGGNYRNGGLLEQSGGTLSRSGGLLGQSGGTLNRSGGLLEHSGETLNRSRGLLEQSGGTLNRSGGLLEQSGGTLNRIRVLLEQSGENYRSGGLLEQSGGTFRTLDRGTMNRENNHNSLIERNNVYFQDEREFPPILQERCNVRVERGSRNINLSHVGEARILSDFSVPLDLGSGHFYTADDPTEHLKRLNINSITDDIGSNFPQADVHMEASNSIPIPNIIQHHTNERLSNSLNTQRENLPNILRNQEMASNSMNLELENSFIPIQNERFLHLDSSIPNIHSRLQERYSDRGGILSERGGVNLNIPDFGGMIPTVHTPQRGLTLGNEKNRTGKVRSSKNSSRINAANNFGSLNRNSAGSFPEGGTSRGAPQGVTAHQGGAAAPSARGEQEGTVTTRSMTGSAPSPRGSHRTGGSAHTLHASAPSPRRADYRLESRNSYTSSASTSRNATPDPDHYA